MKRYTILICILTTISISAFESHDSAIITTRGDNREKALTKAVKLCSQKAKQHNKVADKMAIANITQSKHKVTIKVKCLFK